jgi:hypothetical protein
MQTKHVFHSSPRRFAQQGRDGEAEDRNDIPSILLHA